MIIDSQSKEVRKDFSVDCDVISPPRDNRSVYFTRRVTEADIWLVTLR